MNETWKKEIDGLSKKSKVIGSALTNAQSDLEAFQVCRFRGLPGT